jgi:dihydroflavonol-4-reductase
MRILIIGGTGLLGYHASREFLAHGHQVTILALPPAPAPGLFPDSVEIRYQNLETMTDDDLSGILGGVGAVVFAAGVDDRVTPKAPAYPFFHAHNVAPAVRLARVCGEVGVRKLVILGSYFAYFDRQWPELQLTKHHPYIRSRVEQTRAAVQAAGNRLDVVTLELPYIFGTMPGRMPLWKPLVKYVASPFPLFYTRGGTTCVTVKQVAQAILGAVEHGQAGKCYPIGGENLTWGELLEKMAGFAGKRKRVITLPDGLVRNATRIVKLMHQVQRRESGLDPVEFVRLQTRETFIDPASSRELGVEMGGLDLFLEKTVLRCLQKIPN